MPAQSAPPTLAHARPICTPDPGSRLPCLCPTWQRRLEEQKQELCQRNELASSDCCTATLLELWDEMDDRIGQGVYLVPGGYQHFQDDRQRVVERYRQVPGKGVKVGEDWCLALCVFVPPRCAAQEALLRTSQQLPPPGQFLDPPQSGGSIRV